MGKQSQKLAWILDGVSQKKAAKDDMKLVDETCTHMRRPESTHSLALALPGIPCS